MSNRRNWPISSYDAAFTDGQAETSIAIPTSKGGATSCTIDVTGSDVWVQLNTSSGSLGLNSSPNTKAIKILKDWVLPFPIVLMESGQNMSMTHIKFIPVAGAAGTITVNFFR